MTEFPAARSKFIRLILLIGLALLVLILPGLSARADSGNWPTLTPIPPTLTPILLPTAIPVTPAPIPPAAAPVKNPPANPNVQPKAGPTSTLDGRVFGAAQGAGQPAAKTPAAAARPVTGFRAIFANWWFWGLVILVLVIVGAIIATMALTRYMR
jgi:hypothetical protein